MTKALYKLAFLIAFITLLLCVFSGKTLYTSTVRSVVVYIGVLVITVVVGQLMRLGMLITTKWSESANSK